MDRELFCFERFLTVGGRHPWNVRPAARVCGPVEATTVRAFLASTPWRGATAIFPPRDRDVMRLPWPPAEILSRPDTERIRDDADTRLHAALAIPRPDAWTVQ